MIRFSWGQCPLSRRGRWARIVAFAAACLAASGCGWWDTESAEDTAAKSQADGAAEAEEKKADFSISRVTLAPGDEESYLFSIKPGHWVAASQQIRANNFDFVGHLEATVVDEKRQPIDLRNTRFRLAGTRPVTLAKGQKKHIESTFFVPHTKKATRVSSVLRSRHGQVQVDSSPDLFNAMPPHQYYFLVLCDEPDRYGYLNVLDSIRAPAQDLYPETSIIYYQIVRPRVQDPLPIPSHALVWSPIAYVLWDDVSPTALTDQQQTALVDWLYWGGQLLVSGPDSLDGLHGSFLHSYLPARSTGARSYAADDLRELREAWSGDRDERTIGAWASSPWSGIGLQLQEGGAWVGRTGGLLAERRVGRGRIVVSAVQLAERDLVNWPGYDAFFNACLLRRPPRRYETDANEEVLVLRWASAPQARFDSRRITNLRYFSRDAGRSPNNRRALVQARQRSLGFRDAPDSDTDADWTALGGTASWNPFGDVANAARTALRSAAGIVIPGRDFVWRVLVVYLVVLIPINWAVFRGIRRVEWAWIAAPFVAVGFALMVIRLAQLDIGFARSQTEIAVLEAYAGYPRAHVTRYNALYSSLTTDYDLLFDDQSAVARPLPVDDGDPLLQGQRRLTVTYRRHTDVRLSDMRVNSNTTGMVHSEQMLDLKGAITIREGAGPRLDNKTFLHFEEAFVITREPQYSQSAGWSVCRLASLAPQASMPLKFKPARISSLRDLQFGPQPADRDSTELRLEDLLRVVTRPQVLDEGQTWFVGKSDTPLPGLRIEPHTSQVRSAAFAVVHLKPAPLIEPLPDANQRPETTSEPISLEAVHGVDPGESASSP